MFRFFFALTVLISSAMPASGAGSAEDGRKIAVQHCSRCHVVPDYNPNGGIGSTPSFRLLSELEDGMERFETFYTRRPHPSFVRVPGIEPPTKLPTSLEPVEINLDDIDDIIAYAKRLREWQE